MPNAKPPKTLDAEQQLLLLEALRSDDAPAKTFRKGIRNYLMACLMLDAGLRVGEVCKLKMSHLYFGGQPVRTLLLTPDVTKNKRERTVAVNARLSKAIAEHYEHNPWLHEVADSYSVWGTEEKDTPLTTRQVENILNTAASKSLGRLINPHMLRHTFASRLLRVTNMRTVQELLGHNYITSTQIYTHPNEDDKRHAIDELQKEVTGLGKDLENLAGY